MKQFKTSQKGFTFIEALMSMLILAMTTISIVSLFPVGHHSRIIADYGSKAASLAQKEMENLRFIGFNNLNQTALLSQGMIDSTSPGGGSYTFTNIDVGTGDNVAAVLPQGTATLTITDLTLDTKKISITINWVQRGLNGGNRNESLSTSALFANL